MAVRSKLMRRKILLALGVSLTLTASLVAEDARLVVQEADRDHIGGLGFSADRRLIITQGKYQTRIWDRNGRLIRKITHNSEISAMTVSQSGDIFALAPNTGPVLVYDFKGNLVHQLPKDTKGARSLAFLGKSASLAVYMGMNIYVWDDSDATKVRMLNASITGINLISASPDGQWVAAAGRDGHISLYRVSDGAAVFKHNDVGEIHDLVFSPDSKTLITAHSGKTSSMLFFSKSIRKIAFWDLTGREIDSVSANDQVYSLSLAPDNQGFVSGGYSGYLEFWDFNGKKLREFNTQPGGSEYTSRNIHKIAIDAETGLIITAGWDHSMRGFDAQLNAVFVNKPDYAGTSSVGLDKNGSLLVYGVGKKLGIWSEKMDQPIIPDKYQSSEDPFCVSPEGSRIVITTPGYAMELLDRGGAKLADMRGHRSAIKGIVFLASRAEFLTASRDGSIIVWSSDGIEKTRWQSGMNELHKLSVHEATDQVAISQDNGNIRVFSLTGTQKWSVKNKDRYPWGMDFSPDGKYLAVATFGHGAQIWEANSGKPHALINGDGSREVSVLFIHEGREIAVGTMDGSVIIGDNSGRRKRKLNAFGSTVDRLTLTPNNQYLIASSYVSGLVFYDLKTYAEVARFITSADGSFAMAAADGRYDYSGSGEQLLHWTVGDEAIAVAQFKEKFHTPGLLREFLTVRQSVPATMPEIQVSKRLVGKVFQIKANGDVVIFTKLSGSLRAGKKLKILNGANYVDATISNTLHTNVTAKARGTVAVGNPVFE